MTNPVSKIPSAQVPYLDEQIVDTDRTSTTTFHSFLVGLWDRTGGSKGINNNDLQTVATQAINVAQSANSVANAAQTAAQNAQSTADTAESQALAATQTANLALAQSGSNAYLARNNNLSDLTLVSSARQNLGLSTFPLTVQFDTLPAGFKRGIPIIRPMSLPAGFLGTVCYQGVNTTNDAVFTIAVFRNAVYVTIGTINFVHMGTGFNFSNQASFSLLAGDTLIVQCPSPGDPSLAQVAITFPATIV